MAGFRPESKSGTALAFSTNGVPVWNSLSDNFREPVLDRQRPVLYVGFCDILMHALQQRSVTVNYTVTECVGFIIKQNRSFWTTSLSRQSTALA